MDIAESIVQEGCRRYDLDPDQTTSMGGSEGANFRFIRDGTPYMLRFLPIREKNRSAQEEKWDFIAYLAENGVAVSRPHSSPQNNLIEWITDGDQSWSLVCVGWIEGQNLHPGRLDSCDDETLRAWGRTMGRMHSLAKEYRGAGLIKGWREEATSFFGWCDSPDIKQAWQEMIAEVERLRIDRDCYGLVHNDLHPANLVVTKGGVAVIDFDVCAYHWFICDIAIAMQTVLWVDGKHSLWSRVYREFLVGYERAYSLSAEWMEYLPLFLAYRRLLLYTVYSHEWSQPKVWQKAKLEQWRGGICKNEPVIPNPWWAR